MSALRSLRSKLSAAAGFGESVALIHDLLTEIRDSLAIQTARWRQLAELVAEPRHRMGQVMLLWHATEPSSPGFASVGVMLQGQAQSVEIRVDGCTVPAGAWLVAHGCVLQTVLVGVYVQDLAMPQSTSVCRLNDSLAPGMLLRCVVSLPEQRR